MQRIRIKNAPLKLISLFSGMGGLDYGFEAAGFETRAVIEFNKEACKSIRLNRPWPVMEGDINAVTSQALLDRAGLRKGEPDMLIGGPPCQPFSSVGRRRGLDDPRASTLNAYLRILKDTQPRAFLIENVAGIAHDGKNEGMKVIVRGIDAINRETGSNYKLHWRLVNCAGHGVPQVRKRIFMIASRDGRPFLFPRPRFGSPSEVTDSLFGNMRLEPYRTAWDAIGDLPEPTCVEEMHELRVKNFYGDILPSIPEGKNFLWHTERGALGKKPMFEWQLLAWYPTVLRKLSKRLPSWTILAQPHDHDGPFHWKNRRLNFEELCRLQTFPDGLRTRANLRETQRQLGNAVPSLMAEVLGYEIRRQLLDDPLQLSSWKLTPPLRHDVPPPERVEPLPFRYCALAKREYGRSDRWSGVDAPPREIDWLGQPGANRVKPEVMIDE